jgi:large subunit ribosomal protein L15
MNITEITKAAGAHPKRKRVGRGESSGMGKTSGRGTKGCGARTGWTQRLLYEGGALPIFRRLPKRGFSNFNFRTDYQVVNVGDLEARFDGKGHVTAATLKTVGLIHHADAPVKILGDGTLSKPLTIEAERFSKEAVRKIEAAGGTVKKLGPQPKKKFVRRPPAAPAKPEGKAEGKPPKGEVKVRGGEPKAKGKPKDEKAAPEAPGGESPGGEPEKG